MAGEAATPQARAGVPARRGERHAQPPAERAQELEVRIGLGPAQAVVQVRGVQADTQVAGEVAQADEERGRIGAAAHRDEQGRRGTRGRSRQGTAATQGTAQDGLDPAQAHSGA